MQNKKLLVLSLYSKDKPSTRFRVFQFLPYLDNEGVMYKFAPPLPGFVYKRFANAKNKFVMALIHILEFLNRLRQIIFSFRYDVVLVQKGILPLQIRGMDKLLFLFNRNIIFDLDDAVNLFPVQNFNSFPLRLLEDRGQILKIIKRSSCIFVGNQKLKEDVEGVNSNVFIIPTPVNTLDYLPFDERYFRNGVFNILWSGTEGGLFQLRSYLGPISELTKKYKVRLLVLSNGAGFSDPRFEADEILFIPWSYENEKKAFAMADAGVMFLDDILWDRRKCAFKALLYMANGIPAVSSPVGVVNDIIQDGVNGFLFNSTEELKDKIELLIWDNNLRKDLGLNGRKTIENDFSLSFWGNRWSRLVAKAGGK
ncbi:MAG: glycosyltransferase [Candidatus Omnitrophica bacterium]|nr:glycosyltransferase [Candidatus Omnitrophota bacterium]